MPKGETVRIVETLVKSNAVCEKRAIFVPTLGQPNYFSSVMQTDCLSL